MKHFIDYEKVRELVAFVDRHHDFADEACGCHPVPRVDPCSPWCEACKVLADVPAALLDAAHVVPVDPAQLVIEPEVAAR
jgi:hypothetical protein